MTRLMFCMEWRNETKQQTALIVDKYGRDDISGGSRAAETAALQARPEIIYYHSTPRTRGGGSDPPPVKKRWTFQPICGGRGPLCAWLALNEAVCHKWTLPTPNHSNSRLLTSPTPPYPCITPMSSSVELPASTSHRSVTKVRIKLPGIYGSFPLYFYRTLGTKT